MASCLGFLCGHYLCWFQGFVKTAHSCVFDSAQCSRSCDIWRSENVLQRAKLLYKNLQFDRDGYFWAVIHLVCSGCYRVFQKSQKSSLLSDLDQQYINYFFSVVLLASASHPTGDLLSALEFPFLYFYRFHSGCCASGILGFVLMLLSVKLRSSLSPAHHFSWTFLAKVLTAVVSLFVFEISLNVPLTICFLICSLGEALLIYTERSGVWRRCTWYKTSTVFQICPFQSYHRRIPSTLIN